MGFLKDFKEFAAKGNVIDLTVAVIIGTAFKAIVSSLVNDIVMPPIGQLISGVSFKNLYYNLGSTPYPSLEAAIAAGAPVLKYGVFIQTVMDFIIISFVVFMMIRFIKNLQEVRKQEEDDPTKPAEPPEETLLLREIRDLLNRN